MLADVFQDLLCNRDDYLRAVRALMREIVKAARHDFNFNEFALGLMEEREFTSLESALKVNGVVMFYFYFLNIIYVLNVVNLV